MRDRDRLIDLRAWNSSKDANNIWNMTCIRKTTTEVLGFSREISRVFKDIGGGMKKFKTVKVKKVAHTKWLECVDEDNKEMLKDIYKTTKIEAKSSVTSVKTTTFQCLYAGLRENWGGVGWGGEGI